MDTDSPALPCPIRASSLRLVRNERISSVLPYIRGGLQIDPTLSLPRDPSAGGNAATNPWNWTTRYPANECTTSHGSLCDSRFHRSSRTRIPSPSPSPSRISSNLLNLLLRREIPLTTPRAVQNKDGCANPDRLGTDPATPFRRFVPVPYR